MGAIMDHRRAQVIIHLTRHKAEGSTAAELSVSSVVNEDTTFGSAAAILTDLYRSGKVVKLTERRNGGYVYVLPQHTTGREIIPYTPARLRRFTEDERAYAERLMAALRREADGPNADPIMLSIFQKTFYPGNTFR